MLIKAGVDISRLNREIRKALQVCNKVGCWYWDELVVTSTYEGNHSPGSLHYANDAVDIRRPRQKDKECRDELRRALGKDFDVVLERDHIHIEYDPKGKSPV